MTTPTPNKNVAPERIWMEFGSGFEYTRSDLIPAMLQEAAEKIAFWQADSAKAWDTCEARRLEAEELRAPSDREALVEVIRDSGWSCLDGPEAIADALIADGWRKPTAKGEVK